MTSPEARKKIRDAFSKASESYDLYSETHQRIADYLLCHCPEDFPPGPILDLGAGSGVLTEKLRKFSEENDIVALDISEKMLSKLKSKGSKHQLLCADINNISIANNSFALVTSSTCLQWIDIHLIPDIAKESLKQNGVFALAIIIDGTFKELRRIKSEISKDPTPPLPLPEFYSLKTAIENLQGLKLIRYEKHNFISTFTSMNELLKAIKGLGIGETNQDKLSAQQVTTLKEEYEKQSQEMYGAIALNYEVGFYWGRKL